MENRKVKAGFTLLELLTVMGIMMIMAAIVTASYYSITRGMAMRSATSHLRSNLQLARQQAIMGGKKVWVIFGQDQTNSWYDIVRYEGQGEGASTVLVDEYSSWQQSLGLKEQDLEKDISDKNIEIYNLSTGERGKIIKVKKDDHTIQTDKQHPDLWGKTKCSSNYGWPIFSRSYLPKGIQFNSGTPKAKMDLWVVFLSDGTTRLDPYEFNLYESIHSLPNDPHGKVVVAGLTGFVSSDITEKK